jgi:hypothetical protein
MIEGLFEEGRELNREELLERVEGGRSKEGGREERVEQVIHRRRDRGDREGIEEGLEGYRG